jgi:hypothetical protein
MTDAKTVTMSFAHSRADLRADNPLYDKTDPARDAFRATHDASRAERRESFMVKRAHPQPVLRPSPALSYGSDRQAFDAAWSAEYRDADPDRQARRAAFKALRRDEADRREIPRTHDRKGQ